MSGAVFDRVARTYREELDWGLAVSGETSAYYALERVRWVARCLAARGASGARPVRVLDFGCGTGATAPILRQVLGAREVLGVDASSASVEVARGDHASADVRFETLAAYVARGDFELVYCNGVLHHVAPRERPAELERVRASLAPGGLFSLWENNPWNPGTRWIMRRLPFDRDAILLGAREARRLVREAGLEVLRVDYLFFFPRLLAPLRVLDARLHRVPLGGQYHVLARRA